MERQKRGELLSKLKLNLQTNRYDCDMIIRNPNLTDEYKQEITTNPFFTILLKCYIIII